MFLNTLPFSLAVRDRHLARPDPCYGARRARHPAASRRYPLAELQKYRRDLFDTIFNYVHFHVYEGRRCICQSSKISIPPGCFEQTNFPLCVNFARWDRPANLQPQLSGRADAMSVAELEGVRDSSSLVRSSRSSSTPRSDVPFLSDGAAAARDGDLERCRSTRAATHWLGPLDAQVQQAPDALPSSIRREHLNYRALDMASDRLALTLRERGDRSESIGGLYCGVTRGAGQCAGVWKAGAAFLPLDPDDPTFRPADDVEETQAAAVLADGRVPEGILPPGRADLDIGTDRGAAGTIGHGRRRAALAPGLLA